MEYEIILLCGGEEIVPPRKHRVTCSLHSGDNVVVFSKVGTAGQFAHVDAVLVAAPVGRTDYVRVFRLKQLLSVPAGTGGAYMHPGGHDLRLVLNLEFGSVTLSDRGPAGDDGTSP